MKTYSYHIYSTRNNGGVWFHEDTQAWVHAFEHSTSFQSYELASRIAARLAGEGTLGASHYVLAFVGT